MFFANATPHARNLYASIRYILYQFFSSQLSVQNMSPDEPYPVMVFWHGGAFNTGSSIQYPGHFLAARDVIVVVPNYRLGVFGNV